MRSLGGYAAAGKWRKPGRMRDSICIFAPEGKNKCVAGALPGEQGSPGALHLDGFDPSSSQKNPQPRKRSGIFWQRMRDSNPRKRSQSPVCYRYTNPLYHCDSVVARVLLYPKLGKSQELFFIFLPFSAAKIAYPKAANFILPKGRVSPAKRFL